MAKGKEGAPFGNLNSLKHGKFSKRDFLTCATCAAKSKCQYFNKENQLQLCVFEKRLEKRIEKLEQHIGGISS